MGKAGGAVVLQEKLALVLRTPSLTVTTVELEEAAELSTVPEIEPEEALMERPAGSPVAP
jgi:hypothetical protein